MRSVFMILSPRALPYAERGIASLFRHSTEKLNVRFLTDSGEDQRVLEESIARIANPGGHAWSVFDEAECDRRAQHRFAGKDHLLRLRRGHPCWRKVSDPPLFTEPGEEMVILDPDLYFPNRFAFEPTPQTGVLLMWQKPTCLFPDSVVRHAMTKQIPLAHHVDIGVGHWRDPIDLDWLDWLIGELGGAELPRIMHIEAILWAAIAMRIGGGYLDPQRWLCWRRSQWKRVRIKLGARGTSVLRMDDFRPVKCFHAGGEAKWWLADGEATGLFRETATLDQPSAVHPFVELKPAEYYREQKLKDMLRALGYYQIFSPSS